MNEDIEGIISYTKDYSESSKLVTIITPKYGVINVMAKGSKKIKSSLRSVTDKLTYGIFHINYKKDKLSNLYEVDLIDNFKNIKKDIEKISYAVYLVDLATQVMKQNNSADIYFLLIETLKKIDEGYSPLVLTNILEFKYLGYLGVSLEVDSCSICGTNLDIKTISLESGGYLCASCYHSGKIYDNKVIKLLRMFKYLDIAKIEKLELSKEITKDINQFITSYYETYTGLYLKSKNFINELEKL